MRCTRKREDVDVVVITSSKVVVRRLEKRGVVMRTPQLVSSFQPTVLAASIYAMVSDLSVESGKSRSVGGTQEEEWT